MVTEDKIIKLLNKTGYEFESMPDKFSRYDAFDKERGIMLEIKCRNKHYDDTMMEKIKYEWNRDFAKANGLEFIYAVSMPVTGGYKLYVFDPINMEDEDEYDFKWHTKKLPKNTEFRGSDWVDKEVGYLHIKDALVSIQEKIKH
jgi:hypothetical protein